MLFKIRKHKVKLIIFLLCSLGIFLFNYGYPKLNFDNPDKALKNFKNVNRIFPVKYISKSSNPYYFEESLIELENFDKFWELSATTGLLVIQDDKIITEKYFHGYTKDSKVTSFSVAKSFVSTLVGIAFDQGLIESLDDLVTKYAPSLIGSGYESVTIKDVLLMASGVKFSENYSDRNSDIYKLAYDTYLKFKPIDKSVTKYKNMKPPGKYFNYISVDTQILAMVVRGATNEDLNSYMERVLWEPLGMSSDAYWICDNYGVEMSYMGISTTLRDYAKLGLLYLNNGVYNNNRILSEEWVREATFIDPKEKQPFRRPGQWGYRYQWWIPSRDCNDYSAVGIWGQFIYVHPEKNIVIVKTSADSYFSSRWDMTISVFRSLLKDSRLSKKL